MPRQCQEMVGMAERIEWNDSFERNWTTFGIGDQISDGDRKSLVGVRVLDCLQNRPVLHREQPLTGALEPSSIADSDNINEDLIIFEGSKRVDLDGRIY
jgi:hypothetical protein